MDDILWLLLAVGLSELLAMTIAAVRKLSGGAIGTLFCWAVSIACAVSPMLIPSRDVTLRAIAMLFEVQLVFKIIDFCRHHPGKWDGHIAKMYLRFLIPFPALSVVHPDHQKRLVKPDPVLPHVIRIVLGLGIFAGSLLLMRWLEGSPPIRSSVILNHMSRVAMFVIAIEALAQFLFGIERLAGYETKRLVHNAFLSRSVGEFWLRYNYRIHDWLFRNIFRIAGGRRKPIRSLVFVFIFSGLFHEIGFSIATSRVTGYQLLFFILQIPMVLTSRYFDRLARRGIVGRVISHATTLIFMIATSVLFLDGVTRVFPMIFLNRSALP